MIGVVQLHPYEYAYYNSYVGGTGGAQGQYELEYWCTSYREAMHQLNSLAMPGDKVMALGIDRAARPFAREDITVIANRYLRYPRSGSPPDLPPLVGVQRPGVRTGLHRRQALGPVR